MTHFFTGTYDKGTKTMTLRKEENAGDQIVYHILTYTQKSDGTIRQIWKKSQNKVNWEVNYDGIYKKK